MGSQEPWHGESGPGVSVSLVMEAASIANSQGYRMGFMVPVGDGNESHCATCSVALVVVTAGRSLLKSNRLLKCSNCFLPCSWWDVVHMEHWIRTLPTLYIQVVTKVEETMRDPLKNFDWPSLYSRYDEKCGRYDRESDYLDSFRPDRPVSDRMLYYRLIKALPGVRDNPGIEPIGIYEAFLYWKLYFQYDYKIDIWLPLETSVRARAQHGFLELVNRLPTTLNGLAIQDAFGQPLAFPTSLDKRAELICTLVKWVGSRQIPGMGRRALPTITAFLHFLYPSLVPIYDANVLKAVGVQDKDANHDIKILRQYLPHAWGLAEEYKEPISSFQKHSCFRETPVRLIDMALWVVRGSQDCN